MKTCELCVGCIAAALAACGSEPVELAELDEVCGAPSPVRVLELAPDEVVRAAETVRVGDRVVYVVSRLDGEDPDEPYSATAPSSVWAAGACGEEQVQLAEGIDRLFTVERWPDVVLGCEQATGDVVVLDPTGEQAPHVLFEGVPRWAFGANRCGFAWTDVGAIGLVERDEASAALTLYRYPDDPRGGPVAPEVLLDPVSTAPFNTLGPGFVGTRLYVYSDHLFALTDAGELVRVDLADAAVTTVQAGVAAFEATAGGAYVIWQDATVTGGDAEAPEGKIFLRGPDGEDVLLGQTALQFTNNALQAVEAGRFEFRPGRTATTRVYLLPSLEFVEVPAVLSLRTTLPDGRWIGQTLFDWYLEVIDPRSGEQTRLFPRPVLSFRVDGEVVEVKERRGQDWREEVRMWRVPLDGSAPTLLAERATVLTRRLADGRLLGPLDTGASWLASLIVVEPEGLSESRIDARVHFYSVDATRVDDEGIVSYSVADGERSGVYVAKLPAVERGRAGAQ